MIETQCPLTRGLMPGVTRNIIIGVDKISVIRPAFMRDRKRKVPDRKSAIFDRAESFSFRKQKL